MDKENGKKKKYKDHICKDKILTVVICYLLFANCYFLGAADFGVVLNQDAQLLDSQENDVLFEYRVGLIPRFSALIGKNNSLFMSASVTLKYSTEEDLTVVPEILRTEFFSQIGAFGINAGRIAHSDPLGLITNGLFDGVHLTFGSRAGRFGLGAWYTGLLYKETAKICMTMDDKAIIDEPFSYNNFLDSYFAPERLIASLDWDHPSVGEFMRLRAAVTAQIDLTGGNTKLHSQYLSLKAGIPIRRVLLELGGVFETMQYKTVDTNFLMAFAGEAGVHWTLPVGFTSRISFTGHYLSGLINENIGVFIPVTTKYYGNILQAEPSNISFFTLGWSSRFTQSLGSSLNASYFIRNDLVTDGGFPFSTEGEGGYFLGGELYARLIWSPLSDWQFILGGGTFLPMLGNNWPNEKPKWRLDLTVSLSL